MLGRINSWAWRSGLRRHIGSRRDALINPIRRLMFRRRFLAEHDAETYQPCIGMHTTFIAKENILFLEEWILHHRALGVEHFFLYDNSAVEVPPFRDGRSPRSLDRRRIPYDYLVTMTDQDVQAELDRLQREIPGVHVYEWSPRDENGKVCFSEILSRTTAATRHRDTVDWMLFMDIDEYLVLGDGVELSQLCKDLATKGYSGAKFREHRMENRYRHMDKMVAEIDMECNQHHHQRYRLAGSVKTLCYLPKPKPRWDVHMAGDGDLDWGYAGTPLPLIAGWSGSGA